MPAARARVSVFDRGFLYGDALFETLRVVDGHPVPWRPHLRRLHASLRAFGIARPDVDLEAAARALVAASGRRDGALRVTVTRGTGEGLLPPAGLRPTVVITLRALPPRLARDLEHGISVVRLGFGRGLGRADAGHKSVAYLGSIEGRRTAARSGADDGIFVEADGRVSEATAGNLLVVRGARLSTPPPASGCLPGVTRAIALSLARRAGLDVREEAIPATSLARADEILLTGSVVGILPVVRLDGRPVGTGRPGAVARLLARAWDSHLARSIATDARRRAEAGRRGPRKRR
ncbi:MAG: aminotransferase class IV [Alphaproteobacteria bacterium]